MTVRSQAALPALDLTGTPFSAPGSWLSVSPVVGKHVTTEDLHLASHRSGMHPVFRLMPVADGGPIAATVAATPAQLTWSNSDGVVRLTFAGPERIRISGSGLGFEIRAADPVLTSFEGTYAFADPDSTFVFTSYETGFRYRVLSLVGDAALVGSQAVGAADRAVVVPAGQHGWDLELREYRAGAADGRPRPAFDDLVDSTTRAFASFAEPLVGDPAASTELLACYVLWSALVSPAGFVRRPAILMSKNWMDKVWAWDPCFNAIALAGAHPQLALDQFLAVFDHQDVTTGAVPDSVTHSEVLFNFVKPPVHGWAIEQIRKRLQRPLALEELGDVFEKLSRWTDFWLDHRRGPGSALCHYEHGNDSGWDNATVFAGERLLETADLAALLIAQLRVLAGLAEELGHQNVARSRVDQANAMCAALLEELWDGERFTARSVITGAKHGSNSLLDLIPIVIADQLPNDVTAALVERIEAHLTPVGLATELLSSPLYEADGYWRGPVWAPSTVLIVDGLRRAGRGELADEVAARFRRTCRDSGFAENFDAVTGQGLRDRAYTWTASGYLILQPRREREAAA